MLLFLERWRQRARWIEAEAESLIQQLGPAALTEARRMEREANDFPSVRYWRSVRKAIARETKIEAYRVVSEPEWENPPMHNLAQRVGKLKTRFG